jgi:hypothetical protein
MAWQNSLAALLIAACWLGPQAQAEDKLPVPPDGDPALESGRVVISFPADDNYHPNRWNDPIGPKVRTLLQTSGLPFVVFDQTSPMHGHGAVRLPEFSNYYGDCLRDFVEPSKTPPAGETKCPPPPDAKVVTAK